MIQINKLKISPKRHIASLPILHQNGAIPIRRNKDKNEEEEDNVTKKSKVEEASSRDHHKQIVAVDDEEVIGISISNWEIFTSASTIGNESEMDALTNQMERLANVNDTVVTDNECTKNNETDEKRQIIRKRRLCVPEIVFKNSFVHLKLRKQEIDSEKIISIIFNATDALGEWASCHSKLKFDIHGCADTNGEVNNETYRGVSVIQSIDAKLWSQRTRKQQQNNSDGASTGCFSQSTINSLNTTSEFNYDWTFSTPYTGTTLFYSDPSRQNIFTGGAWNPSPVSLIDFTLLTDQSQPILYFDDINLYEDDMHDNGYVSLRCKLRVMPTCFFILMSLFVRVDHVLLRIKEVRVFCIFSSKMNQYRLCKDVTWKEAKWDELENLNLPSFVGSWRIEDDNSGQATQQRIQGLIKRLPMSDLPNGIFKHSFIDL
jgi:hypothetical protein